MYFSWIMNTNVPELNQFEFKINHVFNPFKVITLPSLMDDFLLIFVLFWTLLSWLTVFKRILCIFKRLSWGSLRFESTIGISFNDWLTPTASLDKFNSHQYFKLINLASWLIFVWTVSSLRVINPKSSYFRKHMGNHKLFAQWGGPWISSINLAISCRKTSNQVVFENVVKSFRYYLRLVG